MDSNKCSVIIPFYNRSDLLLQTLSSVVSQTYTNLECLVIDDNSDERIEITDITRNDARIKYIKRNATIRNASACRNIGIQNSQGEYIVFLDSDDLLAPHALEQRIKAIEDSSFDFMVFPMQTFFRTLEKKGIVINKYSNEEAQYLQMFLSYNIPWAITCPIWKRESLLKLDGFNESYSRLQDVELHTRALLQELKFAVVNCDPDCYYRLDDGLSKYKNPEFVQRVLLSSKLYYSQFYPILNSENRRFLRKGFFRTFKLFILPQSSKMLSQIKEYLNGMFLVKLISRVVYFQILFLVYLYFFKLNKFKILRINFLVRIILSN